LIHFGQIRLKFENLIIYFNDYFIINLKCGKSGKFDIKDRKGEKSTLRAFARTRAKNANFWQEILKSLGNLATWQFGNLATWQFGNLAT
jgi:hypothetical protein